MITVLLYGRVILDKYFDHYHYYYLFLFLFLITGVGYPLAAASQPGRVWDKLGLPVSSVWSKQAIPIKSCLVYPFSIAVGLLFTPALNRLKVEVRTRRLTPLVRPRDTPHWLSGLR